MSSVAFCPKCNMRPCYCNPISIPQTGTRPHTCPVCLGRGTVPVDFYEQIGFSTSTGRSECRSCGGRGILWGAA